MKLFFKSLTIVVGSAFVGLAFGLVVSYAQVVINAWVAPLNNDPLQYNVTGLLNMGPVNQEKLARLTLGGNLTVNGAHSNLFGQTTVNAPGNTALSVNGKVQVQDNTQGYTGIPFVTNDGAGTGRWAPSGGTWGCVSGSCSRHRHLAV